MPDVKPSIAPVRKTVTVSVPPAEAFEIFTAEIGSWWPLATHSVGLEHAVGVTMGTSVGEQLVEVVRDGTTSVWGTITRFDPPHELAFTWHPGKPAENSTMLEITFTGAPGGSTVVELVHSGWERLRDGEAIANGYKEGWNLVLGLFSARAEGSNT